MIYYPLLMSQQQAYKHFPTSTHANSYSHAIVDQIVALPMHAYMDQEDARYITNQANAILTEMS